ncbi:MAG: helix-turn-helix transcriptional regulator [bacterium]|nr:helix-turn-helix transcriptional regulator [bacterium]
MNDPIIQENLPLPVISPRKLFRLIYITSGRGTVSLLGKQIIITAPACFCLNEKEDMSIEEAESLQLTQIEFHPSYVNSQFDFTNLDPANLSLPSSAELDKYYLRPFLKREDSYEGFFIPDPADNLVLRKNIQSFIDDSNDTTTPFYPCRRRSSFINLLLFLCNNYRKYRDTPAQSLSLVERVISFLTDNYQDKITIADLCARFETNRNTLAKKFKEETGSSVMDSLAHIRIQMALVLLKETALPVADILYRVGYNDAAHFGRTFKKITGRSPSEYRAAPKRK